jgi:natural product biosynthesis luciferase-like monooxygenase protein
VDFSLMFWGDAAGSEGRSGTYDHVLRIARYADDHGYCAVWLPERHFHPWGGLHPNPAILASALAPLTRNIKLRAGSVVLPLHNPIRVAEEWAVVDNLSGGRVELAIATGWKDDDFVLAPEKFNKRKSEVWDAIETVEKLWRGEKIKAINGHGREIEIQTFPRPVQPQLPVWITSSGGLRTMSDAGHTGYNLLTHLLMQSFQDVESKIAQYKAYRVRAGFQGPGKVALMAHTFLGHDRNTVKEKVRGAMSAYLRNSADLMVKPEQRAEWNEMSRTARDEMAAVAFERYFETASLMGTPDTARTTIRKLEEMGVSEICCLVDFGLSTDDILEGLTLLTEVKDWSNNRSRPQLKTA